MSYNQVRQFSDFLISRYLGMAFCCIIAMTVVPSVRGESGVGDPVRVLFFGDSLTAGYGLDPSRAYPALIQKKIDAAEIHAKVAVGAVSGDTSAGGLRRIDWMLRQPVDIFVLALGANDGLRGVELSSTAANLNAILRKVRTKHPEARLVVAGMRMPPSIGADYAEEFAAIFPTVAASNEASLIPFLLAGVGGVVELNLPDRIHPNAKGQEILAENVWQVLGPLLKYNLD